MTSTVGAPSARSGQTAEQPSAARAEYWDEITGDWSRRGDLGAWRSVSDAVNADLIERWLPGSPDGRVLKTDLFDELVGRGLVGALSKSSSSRQLRATLAPAHPFRHRPLRRRARRQTVS